MSDYSITELNISDQGLVNLPDDIDKYTNIKILNCRNNNITSLDNLPPTLQWLFCSNNEITNLDNLPPTLQRLFCNENQITNLDNIPPTLQMLECDKNPLTYTFEPTLENIRNYNNYENLSRKRLKLV